MIKKYYTYHDEFGKNVSVQCCHDNINNILMSNSREQWVRFLGHLANKFAVAGDLEDILEIQYEILNIPINRNIIVFHKQAMNACFQYLSSIPPDSFSAAKEFNPYLTFLLFIFINQVLADLELTQKNQSTGKKLLYSSIKSIQFTQVNSDLRGTFDLFNKFNEKIKALEDSSYNSIIFDKYGIKLDDLCDELKKHSSKTIFNLLERFAAIKEDDLHKEWTLRKQKINPPQDLFFMKKYPLIKINNDLIPTDFNNLFDMTFRLVYSELFQSFPIEFKPKFGIDIVEPVIKDLIRSIFISDSIKEIKIATKSYEYGDMGLVQGTDIYLFEIKSTCLNLATLYEDDIVQFYQKLNDRFVLKEGVMQQVKKIDRINNEPKTFYSVASLNPDIKYKIHPVLLVFEETLQAICANWYFSSRFDILMRVCKVYPRNIELSNHITLTFNELYRLTEISHSEKLELLKLYSQNQPPYNFSFFLQENQIN